MPHKHGQRLPLTGLSYEVLLSVAAAPLHGYGILKSIADRSDGAMAPDTGTLYTAIRRLVERGFLEASPGAAGARRTTYVLTDTGRDVLVAESERLAALVVEARSLRLLSS